MGKLSEIFDINYKMAALSRYSQTHLVNNESVLEHTGFVCVLSYFIGKMVIDESIKNGIVPYLNIGEIMCKAAMHDVDEIITGDIPRPTKYYNEGVRSALQKIENENMISISNSIGIEDMYDDWKYAKDGNEGAIVALCDCLAVVYKIYYECIMFGNKTIIGHCKNLNKSINKIISGIEEKNGPSEILCSIYKDAIIMLDKIQKLEEQ